MVGRSFGQWTGEPALSKREHNWRVVSDESRIELSIVADVPHIRSHSLLCDATLLPAIYVSAVTQPMNVDLLDEKLVLWTMI